DFPILFPFPPMIPATHLTYLLLEPHPISSLMSHLLVQPCPIILLSCPFFPFPRVLDHLASPNLSAILNLLILLLFQMIYFHHLCTLLHSRSEEHTSELQSR